MDTTQSFSISLRTPLDRELCHSCRNFSLFYARHNFRGLNAFLVEMFNQFDDVHGVREHDYMTGSKLDIQHAVDDLVRQASSDTAQIEVTSRWNSQDELLADVDIKNLVGPRFPSGVGFRRAFIELLVIDETQPLQTHIVWFSGRTNERVH